MFEEMLAFLTGVLTILLIMNSFRQNIKVQQNLLNTNQENSKKQLPLMTTESNNEKETIEHPQEERPTRKLSIPPIETRSHKVRQNCMELRPFKTNELESSSIPPIEDRIYKIKQQCISLRPFKTVELNLDSTFKEKYDYMRVKDLKTLSFHDLILSPYFLIQNLNYLAETLNLAKYKFDRGEELKDNLDNLLNNENEEKLRNEGEMVLKRITELTEYIKNELEIKELLSEDLQEVIEWIKELDANKSMEMKSLIKNLFNIEKKMILLLDITSKLQKQTDEIKISKEKLVEKYGNQSAGSLLTMK
jgi:hypothetical protein